MIDNLYLQNNYLDMGAVLKAPYPFTICVSARGGGKTYGILEACVINHLKFIYVRTSKTILDMITDSRYQPFKKINANNGWRIEAEYSKGLGTYINRDTGEIVGYAAALSVFSNIRSIDGSDILVFIYDEFIPQENDIVRFNTFPALLHAVETIGRNREQEGQDPLKVVLLSNSDLIYGDIVAGFNIGDDLLWMQENKIEQFEKSRRLKHLKRKSRKLHCIEYRPEPSLRMWPCIINSKSTTGNVSVPGRLRNIDQSRLCLE